MQYLECGVILGLFGLPGGLSGRVIVVHVVDLLVDLDLSFSLQRVEQLLLLSVLFQLFNVASETAAHIKAEAKTNNTCLVDHDKVQSLVETSHIFKYYIKLNNISLCEERVLKTFSGSQSLIRIFCQQLLHQVLELRRKRGWNFEVLRASVYLHLELPSR